MNDGISEDDATMMTQRLTRLLNEAINIPFISEQKEEKLISLVIGYIVGAMVKGTKLVGEKLA
jgi:Txe/YoeB family toxin of Txe-Axe toxin-antitoxin module